MFKVSRFVAPEQRVGALCFVLAWVLYLVVMGGVQGCPVQAELPPKVAS